MTAADTFAFWTSVCLASGHGGGDNLLRIGRERYVISDPRTLDNGAMVGRIHRFTPSGLSEVGRYKIGADGAVINLPPGVLHEHLRAASAEAPSKSALEALAKKADVDAAWHEATHD